MPDSPPAGTWRSSDPLVACRPRTLHGRRMSLLRFLGLGHDAPAGAAGAGAETARRARAAGRHPKPVRRVVAALDRMEPEAARHVARFAYVLGRVASADQGV